MNGAFSEIRTHPCRFVSLPLHHQKSPWVSWCWLLVQITISNIVFQRQTIELVSQGYIYIYIYIYIYTYCSYLFDDWLNSPNLWSCGLSYPKAVLIFSKNFFNFRSDTTGKQGIINLSNYSSKSSFWFWGLSYMELYLCSSLWFRGHSYTEIYLCSSLWFRGRSYTELYLCSSLWFRREDAVFFIHFLIIFW